MTPVSVDLTGTMPTCMDRSTHKDAGPDRNVPMTFRISKTIWLPFFLAAALVAQSGDKIPTNLKPPPADRAAGFATITPDDCKTWLSTLASDDFEGRGTGQAGYQKAADYVAAHFKEWGLTPVGDKNSEGQPTYFQNMMFEGSSIDVAGAVFEYSGGKEPVALKMGEGWSASGSGNISGEWPVVFVSGKASAKELGSLDVSGKAVIFMPVAEATSGARGNRAGRTSRDLASKAAAVFTVNDVAAARLPTASSVVPKSSRSPSSAGEGPAARRAPTLSISTAAAKSIAAAAGVDLDKLVASATDAPVSKPGKGKIKVGVTTETKEIPVPNVIGSLEGSDPTLKSEVVIVGSHLDHLGRSATGEIFNGADDDGSGSTGLLAVARAFAKNGTRPKRTMVFIAMCGEEMGLLGSGYYVENPIFPIEKTVAEFQMDMIGRNEEHHPSENPTNEKAEENVNTLHLIGSKKLSTQLHDIIEATNTAHVGFVFEYDQEGVYYRSDHYNFAKKGIPISFYFSGFHPDYHRATDDVEKIDFSKVSRTAKLVYLSAYEVADRTARVVVDKKPETERRRRG